MPSAIWSVANVCRKQWNVIRRLIPAVSIHLLIGREIHDGSGKSSNMRRSLSPGVPQRLYAWSEIGWYSTPFVFFCVKLIRYCSPTFWRSPQWSFLISQWRSPVNAANRAARFMTGLSHGVFASKLSSGIVRNSRRLSSSAMPLALAARSTDI